MLVELGDLVLIKNIRNRDGETPKFTGVVMHVVKLGQRIPEEIGDKWYEKDWREFSSLRVNGKYDRVFIRKQDGGLFSCVVMDQFVERIGRHDRESCQYIGCEACIS